MTDSTEHDHRPRTAGRGTGGHESELAEHTTDDASVRDPYFQGRLIVLKDDLSTAYQHAVRMPRGTIPRTWPQLLHYAVGKVCPSGEYTDAEYLTRFEQRFGSCSMVHLAELAEQHASVRTGSVSATDTAEAGDEIQFVLLMLGVWPEYPEANVAREMLRNYLPSPELSERIASAVSLSHLHDERAIPILIALLTDGLLEPELQEVKAEEQAGKHEAQFVFQSFDMHGLLREEIPEILVRWKAREAIPALRHALDLTTQIEHREAHLNPHWRSLGHWRTYQWELVSALGRFGAFGALTGIEAPEENLWRLGVRYNVPEGTQEPIVKGDPKTYLLQRWQVLLCYEAIHQRFADAGRHGTLAGMAIQLEVERLLAEQFGLDEGERRAALAAFGTEIPPLTLE